MPVSSHKTTAFPTLGPGRRVASPILWQLQYGAYFEATVIRSSSGPQICSPPRLLLPQRRSALGSHGFYVHAYLGLLPPRAVDMLTVRFGQLPVGGLSPPKIRSLAGCSPNVFFSRRALTVGWKKLLGISCHHFFEPSFRTHVNLRDVDSYGA